MKITINTTTALSSVAESLLSFAKNEKIFCFYGNMGAGKTTFIKTLCQYLGVTDTVSSPTFSIVNEYDIDGKALYHFDFYRIKDLHEAYDLGYEEYFYSGNYCFIEWPEKIEELIPERHITVKIVAIDEDTRTFEFERH